MDCQVEVCGQVLKLTNLEREYWPGIKKSAFLDYWRQAGPWALPYLAHRPLSLLRAPYGKKPFWQKNLPRSAPCWLPSFKHNETRYLLANNLAALLWAANLGAIELHPWAATTFAPAFPDFAILDLDPMPPGGFSEAKEAAFAAQKLAQKLDLVFYPKTSGASGIHLYLPLERRYPNRLITTFMEKFCQIVAQALPELATVERLVKNRAGKVYLDYLQNLPTKTIVAAYSPRARKEPTVSCPLTWDELATADPRDFTIRTVPGRLAKYGDLWQGVLQGQNIDQALARLGLKAPLLSPHSARQDSTEDTGQFQAPKGP